MGWKKAAKHTASVGLNFQFNQLRIWKHNEKKKCELQDRGSCSTWNPVKIGRTVGVLQYPCSPGLI